MKKILLISGEYFPYTNANTNCMDRMMQELIRRGHQVSVLTMSYDKSLPLQQEIHGIPVYRAYMSGSEALYHFFTNWKAKSRAESMIKAVLSKILYSGAHLTQNVRFRQTCRQLHKTQDFDCVISGLCPTNSHKMAYAFLRGRKMKWIMYNMDSYVFNCGPEATAGSRMRIEKKWCRIASGVVNSWGLNAYNQRRGYNPYEKLKQLEIPLPNWKIDDMNLPQNPPHDGRKIELVYTGSFLKGVRQPEELMRFLRKLDAEKYSAKFYGLCCPYLERNVPDLPRCVKLMGSVQVEQCKKVVREADILLNGGNTCTNQMPSKVFDYIGTGKPILNFYSLDEELAMQYLRLYPRILHAKSADEVEPEMLESLLNTKPVSADALRAVYADALEEKVVCRFADFVESV